MRARLAAVLPLALLGGCGDAPPRGGAGPAAVGAPAPGPTAPAAAATPVARPPADPAVLVAAQAVLGAVDVADAGRFAALAADRKDAEARPVPADDVRATLDGLHRRYGLRPRQLGTPLVAEDGTCEVEVRLEDGGSLTLTLRRAADGAWRLVGLSEAEPPSEGMAPATPPPAPAGAPAPMGR